MTRFLALATLPSGRFAYVPVDAEDRDQATLSVSADTKVHAILTDAQLRVAQMTIEQLPEPDTANSKRWAVIMIMADGEGVIRGAMAPTSMEARQLINTLTLDAEGNEPAVNLGAFDLGHIQAMREAMVTGHTHVHV